MVHLRGHHLLCLLGYQGMGYSQEYVENMTRIHQTLRNNPQTEILLVLGPDELCRKFPDNQPYHCKNTSVYDHDAAVLRKLGLKVGQKLTWKELEDALIAEMQPADIPRLCSKCAWLSYGVCEQGVRQIKSGAGLPLIR